MANDDKDLPKSAEQKLAEQDANRDPLSGRAGAHPVGTGIGAATGGITGAAIAGAAIGAAGGPMGAAAGAAAGAVVGAVAGGLAGKAVAEEVNPTEEHGFWRSNYASRPYALPGVGYDEFAPAYQFGWESERQFHGNTFDEVESTLKQDWEKARGASKLAWDKARSAVKDSWNRMAGRDRRANRAELDRDLDRDDS